MNVRELKGPNFAGRLIFVDKKGISPISGVEKYLIDNIGSGRISKAADLLENKPYDVFVQRSEKSPQSLLLHAAGDFEQVLLDQGKTGAVVVKDLKNPKEALLKFGDTLKSLIDDYDNFLLKKIKLGEVKNQYKLTEFVDE